jgi:hypothetical protein
MRTARDLSVFILALVLLSACTTDRTRRGYLRNAAPALAPPTRPVIVIPGFGVTRLFDPVRRRYVWGTPRTTMHRQYEDDLDLPPGGRDRLVPRGFAGSRGPINTAWQLTAALRKYGGYTVSGNLYAFDYDWRLSARDNALLLGELVERVRGTGSVDIVTHSAGSLIALTYVKLQNGGSRVENLILIAPPQRGVADAFRVLVRPERFIRRVFHAETVATWPFLYELMPEDGRFLVNEEGTTIDFDVWEPTWRGLSARVGGTSRAESPRNVTSARKLRDELNASPLPSNVRLTVIAGDCVPTARRVLARKDGSYVFYRDELRPGEQHLADVLFEPGDGTVPVSSATAGAEASLFCDGHQGIATDPSVHRALIRALHSAR